MNSKVRVVRAPVQPIVIRTLVDAGIRLRSFIRKHSRGGCRLFSNPDCQCPLCDADELGKAASDLHEQARKATMWLNGDGSPCDGPRFRDEMIKLRSMVTEDESV